MMMMGFGYSCTRDTSSVLPVILISTLTCSNGVSWVCSSFDAVSEVLPMCS